MMTALNRTEPKRLHLSCYCDFGTVVVGGYDADGYGSIFRMSKYTAISIFDSFTRI